jgi:hypothetical protein
MIIHLDMDESEYTVRITFVDFNYSPFFCEICMFAKIEDVLEL